MGLLKEFRDFAMRGNVIDLAVGVIIGAAFGGIVNSLVKDVIMPIVGMAGDVDFSNQYILLKGDASKVTGPDGLPVSLDKAREVGSVLAYGNFVTILINFIIVAFCIFMVIKLMNSAMKRFEKEKAVAPPPTPTPDVILLTEIRDLLKVRG